MKHTFTSRELAHVWVSETTSYGKCPSNQHFQDDLFFSHSTPVGKRLRAKDGAAVYVIDACSYSNTTAKHLGRLRAAVHNHRSVTVFYGRRGDGVRYATAADVVARLLAKAKEHNDSGAKKQLRFRTPHYAAAAALVEDALQVAAWFKLRKPATARLRVDPAELAAAQAANDTWNEGKEARRAKRDDARRERWKKQRAIAALADAEKIELWKAGETNVWPASSWPALLRIEGDEVVTTKGARFSVEDGRRAFAFAQRVRKSGNDWRRNGETFAVGRYQLDAINKFGIVAGCHELTWAEIDRFAAVAGWSK